MNQDLIDGFTEYEKQRGIKHHRKCRTLLKPFACYLETRALSYDQVGHTDAQNYQTYLATLEDAGRPSYCTAYVSELINCVNRFYNYLEDSGRVATNPFRGIKNIKTGFPLPRNILFEADIMRLLAYFRNYHRRPRLSQRRIDYKMHVITELMYATGLRSTEVADLEEKDIDFDGGILNVIGKGDKPRTVYLNRYAAHVLRHFLDMRAFVIRTDSPKLFGSDNHAAFNGILNNNLKRATQELGLKPFTSHNFRHCLGFHLLHRGCDMRYIQDILGHEKMDSTVIYTKVDKTDLLEQIDRYHPRQFRREKEA
jgi:site-specific recombinase XerD